MWEDTCAKDRRKVSWTEYIDLLRHRVCRVDFVGSPDSFGLFFCSVDCRGDDRYRVCPDIENASVRTFGGNTDRSYQSPGKPARADDTVEMG